MHFSIDRNSEALLLFYDCKRMSKHKNKKRKKRPSCVIPRMAFEIETLSRGAPLDGPPD